MKVVSACLMLALLAACIPSDPVVSPVSVGPIAYFEKHCANCHGSGGSGYGADFGKGLTDEKLREVVDQMALGPAQAPLEGRDLDALVAYHRALIKEEPFIVLTERAGNQLSGEVKGSIEVGGRAVVRSYSDDETWRVELAPGSSLANLDIQARSGQKRVRLDLRKASFTHSEPLKP